MTGVTLWSAFWGCERWKDRRGLLKAQLWAIPIMRLDNRWQDVRAVLAGACNASTWTGVGYSGYAGGYSHWRCGRRRGHLGAHRFNSYTWSGDPYERVRYDPLPVTNPDGSWFDSRPYIPFRKLTNARRAVETRARARQTSALQEIYLARRNAERTGS